MFCVFYRARSSRRNSREVAVSKAASAQSRTVRTARVMREGTDTATEMSAQPEGVVPEEVECDASAQRDGWDSS